MRSVPRNSQAYLATPFPLRPIQAQTSPARNNLLSTAQTCEGTSYKRGVGVLEAWRCGRMQAITNSKSAAAAVAGCAQSWSLPRLPPVQHRTQPVRRAVNNSFDADEELDTDLAEELSRFRSPDTWNKVAQHLDLVWKIGRGRGKRAVCGCCQGSGEEECAWCHGTGALMVGDTLFRSGDGRSHCPVCKGKGYVPCENCRGTGYRASWMQGPDHCKNPT